MELTCDMCHIGFLKERTGKFGTFYGCSNYPNCTHKMTMREYLLAIGDSDALADDLDNRFTYRHEEFNGD